MKSRQESKLSMYLAVKDYLTTNAAVVNPLPNYSGYATAFFGAIGQIQTHIEQQMFDKSGLCDAGEFEATFLSTCTKL